jgi:acyl-CoA synthetase (AMP-forming)/AMP-acid ligase II
MNKILTNLYRSIDEYSCKTAVNDGHEEWNYAELGDHISIVQEKLYEISQGQQLRIGIYLQNSANYISSYYGVIAGKCLPFLIDKASNKAELNSIHNTCGVSHFIIDENTFGKFPLDNVQQVASLDKGIILIACKSEPSAAPPTLDDTVTCRFTSGSSGVPKCLEFSDTAIVSAAKNWIAGTKLKKEDKILCIAGISNGLAFNTSLLSTIIAGAELHLYTGIMMAARVLDVINQRQITRLVGFPAIYQHMVSLKNSSESQNSSLTLAISASASLDPDIRGKFLQRFDIDISDYYGIAETGPVTFEPDPSYNEGLGLPLPGVEIRIDNSRGEKAGAIQIKTESFASRYLNHFGEFSKKLTPDGYYKSDDLGTVCNYRLYLHGTSSKSANIGGRNVYTTEISSFLQRMPGMTDVELFVDKDKQGQDVLHALIVAAPTVTRETIISACRSNLASFKIPSRITFVDKIPRSGVGKATRSTLLELVQKAN